MSKVQLRGCPKDESNECLYPLVAFNLCKSCKRPIKSQFQHPSNALSTISVVRRCHPSHRRLVSRADTSPHVDQDCSTVQVRICTKRVWSDYVCCCSAFSSKTLLPWWKWWTGNATRSSLYNLLFQFFVMVLLKDITLIHICTHSYKILVHTYKYVQTVVNRIFTVYI